MKKLLTMVALAISLQGCGGYHPVKCLQAAQEAMPNAEVIAVPKRHYNFLARQPDGSLWYLETMNQTDCKVSAKAKLLAQK